MSYADTSPPNANNLASSRRAPSREVVLTTQSNPKSLTALSLNGNTTYTDVTFRNTDSYIVQARSNHGSVLDAAEASKHRKYHSYCNTLDATFAALACSVSGVIGAEFLEFLFYMANHALSSPIVHHIQNKTERANLLKILT